MFRICSLVLMILCGLGCNEQKVQLQEVRSNWKIGPEFRDRGETHHERWTAQTGLEGIWNNGWKTGLEYRNRSNSHTNGYDEQDNGVWFTFSFPIWTAKKVDKTAELQKRIERLEAQIKATN